jgi:hypothetical protein
MDRSPEGGEQLDTGGLYSVNVTHARAVNDRWAYKLSAGYLSSDAFSRPVGTIPNPTQTMSGAAALIRSTIAVSSSGERARNGGAYVPATAMPG